MFKWYWSILEETEGQDMPPEGSEGVAGTPSTRSEWYAGAATDGKKGRSANGEGGGEQKPSGPLYDFGEWLRQWFAVDEIENEDGETEVYLSTTIEFTAALMLVIVFGSRAVNALAHYLVDAASGMGADPLM